MTSPLLTSHHSAIGAWASLAFGGVGAAGGLSIQSQGLAANHATNANLLVALHRPGAGSTLLPFANSGPHGAKLLSESDLQRKLTPCIDEFTAANLGLTLRVFTPHAAVPNPKRSGNLQYATAPALLLELAIDNSQSDEPARGFVGIDIAADPTVSAGNALGLRRLDWTSRALCGIGHAGAAGRWLLAANVVKDEVFGIMSPNWSDLSDGLAGTVGKQTAGGIVVSVAPRATKTIPLVFASFEAGLVTQGIDGRQFYTTYFPRIEAAANFILHNAGKVKESCASFDTRTAAACPDPQKLAIFSHALRAYESRSQIIESGGPAGTAAYFSIISEDGRRNALERVVDHLPWELFRNPWVIRNIFDLATITYAYHDKVRFPSDVETPDELRKGGMTFARDFGYGTAYAPGYVPPPPPVAQAAAVPGGARVSAFDGAGSTPGWSGGKLATEVLLNSVFMLTSYALTADDTPWAKTRLPFARELLVSMENRDYWDPEKRTGILKGESDGAGGAEETVFAAPGAPAELAAARGNLYLGIKTFCANMLLTTYFQNNNDLHSADYSYAFAQKTAAALTNAFNKDRGLLPANLLAGGDAAMLAALEPFAVPTYLGLTTTLAEYFPDLYVALKAHVESCLQQCAGANGALRLISGSDFAMPAKMVSVLFVLERLFAVEPAKLAPTWEALSKKVRDADTRLITTALFVKPG